MISRMRSVLTIAAFMTAVVIAGTVTASAQGRAAEFSLHSIDGEAVTSQSLHGEVAVLAFGASWLPLTRNQMEAVKKLADGYAGRGVVVYWVSTESDNPKSKNFAADDQLRELARKYKVTVLRDSDGAVAKRLGVDQVPSILIIDKQGTTAFSQGGMDPNANLVTQLSEKLNKLL
jgi:peroxiredoxin